ncbi:hypothetical protein Cgig2_016650 [Carnegiea gigantea]|uniref:Major facilitator superfamily (MFS) profile domain-containing protein n=1 Tax=Carnegiea gigantea TaxID=171969 RepID=A0A9Q1QS27_9CARY|nr:hypothetical protein Cgig2_016650 [Carnegiea gigantea]
MRGRQTLGDTALYKRVPSRDHLDDIQDRRQGLAKEGGNPSWKRSLRHVLVATISSFLFGYHLGVVNDTLESISIDLGFRGNTVAEGLVVSICLGGAFVGSIFSGSIADHFGRRRSFQLCALPMIIGASLSATTSDLTGMLLGRFLVGNGMGLGPSIAALYVAEVSPANVRGTFGSLPQIATCLGLMAAFSIGIPAKDTKDWWRVCFWVPVIPAALLAVLMELCAESPHWLSKKGRSVEAEAEFERLLGGLHVKSAIADLSKLERGDEADGVKFSELLYGSFVATILMDKLGRKLLLMGSFLGMAMSLTLQITAASSFVSHRISLYLSVGGVLLVVLTFALGAGPVPTLLLSEIFPNRIRAKAMALCLAVHWVINFFVGLLFLRLLEQLGPKLLYAIFATFCFIGFVFVKRNVLETKGKSLQEIELALLPS